MVQKTLPLITSSISVHMCFSYKEKPVPEWIRKILLDKIAVMLCKYRFFKSLFPQNASTLQRFCDRSSGLILWEIQQTSSTSIITARKRSLGQDNIFTSVCHYVHKEVVLASQHASQVTCLPSRGVCLQKGLHLRGGLHLWVCL